MLQTPALRRAWLPGPLGLRDCDPAPFSSASRTRTICRPVLTLENSTPGAALPDRCHPARRNPETPASLSHRPCAVRCLPARCGSNRRGKILCAGCDSSISILFPEHWLAYVLRIGQNLLKSKAMPIRAKYVHTNLIARDWKRLARFYCDVFGCEPQGPERDLSGAWLDRVSAVPHAALRGVHLR